MSSLRPLWAPDPAQPTTLHGASIVAVGCAVPERAVTNAEIAARVGVSEEWILSRTGIRERHIAAPSDRLSDLAAVAGQRALDAAGLDASELDLVIVATLTADDVTPNAAPLVAHELGAMNAGAFDVGAACTGFLTALAIASGQIEAGRFEHALVIGAEVLSRVTDQTDRNTSALFGDGAGAVVVGPSAGAGHIGPIVLRADGAGAGVIRISQTERKIRMQGHETFREAVRRLSESTVEAAQRAGVSLDEIDLFVYHQANTRILAAVGERLGLPAELVVDCIDRYGNTSSATIPIALAHAAAHRQLQPGMTVLLGAFGAGLTWGAGVVEWC